MSSTAVARGRALSVDALSKSNLADLKRQHWWKREPICALCCYSFVVLVVKQPLLPITLVAELLVFF